METSRDSKCFHPIQVWSRYLYETRYGYYRQYSKMWIKCLPLFPWTVGPSEPKGRDSYSLFGGILPFVLGSWQ